MIRDVTHHTIHREPERCVNQVATRLLSNGDLVAVFNEERYPFHHDSGRTVLKRSRDGGLTWQPDAPQIVLDWTETTGNWDCGICELQDGTLVVNLTITGFFKRGQKPGQPSWASRPWSERWGDWTWAYKTQSWLGTYVVKSKDGDLVRADPSQRSTPEARRLPSRLLAAAFWRHSHGPVRPDSRLWRGGRERIHPLGADDLGGRWR
jgi:sialidase-1